MKRILLLAIFVAAVSLGACAKESKLPTATGEGSVRAINAIPTSPPFIFRIEETVIATVDYKASSSIARYDDLDYTFNFEVSLAVGQDPARVANQHIDVVANRDYTFIISGALAAPDITLLERDIREWSGSETVFEAQFGHSATSLGDIDIYFLDPTIAPALGLQFGTLAFGEIIPGADFEEGEYVLTITSAGDDPADVSKILFQTDPFTVLAQTESLINVFDGTANDFSALAVRRINLAQSGATLLIDNRSEPTRRFFHASMNMGAVDIYIDDPLTTPFVTDHAFADITDDLELPAGDLPLTYTTAGTMGSILIDDDVTIISGTHNYIYAVENSVGDDVLIRYFPDRRPIETMARLSIINTTTSNAEVDVYIVDRDEPLDDALPLLNGLPLGREPLQLPISPMSYDIYVTVPDDKTLPALAGPIPYDPVLGDVHDVIIYENVDPNVVDFVFTSGP